MWVVCAKQLITDFHWWTRPAVVYFRHAHSQAHMGLVTTSFASPPVEFQLLLGTGSFHCSSSDDFNG